MQIGQARTQFQEYTPVVEAWEQLFVNACFPHALCIAGETWKSHLQQTMRRSSNRA